MEEQRTVTLWSANGLTVTARRGLDDNLVISGQDLRPNPLVSGEVTEYEYGLSVGRSDIPAVLAALRAAPDADVLDVLENAGPELVKIGESRWLAEIGVEADFWSSSE
jgi:hypothetical protein